MYLFAIKQNLTFFQIQMGLTDLFSTTANLAGILDTKDQLAVSKMVHKAIIEINESGTEAAGECSLRT